MRKNYRDVDEYIASVPPKERPKLSALRNLIRRTVPGAEEKISYKMPYYGYHGRLAYFMLAKNHIGFYIMPEVIAKFKSKLKGYSTSVGAIRFPLDKPLPAALIRRMIKARAQLNEKKDRNMPAACSKRAKGSRTKCSRGHIYYKCKECPVCPVCWPGRYAQKLKTG